MENKEPIITACIKELNLLRQKENITLKKLLSLVSLSQTELQEDDYSSIFNSPLACCGGCQHWNNSFCDMILQGCIFEPKF